MVNSNRSSETQLQTNKPAICPRMEKHFSPEKNWGGAFKIADKKNTKAIDDQKGSGFGETQQCQSINTD